MDGSTTDVEFVRRTHRPAASQLPVLRRDLGRWLSTVHIPEAVHAGVLSATAEAVRNAAEHAYPGRSGPIRVHATVQHRFRRLTVLVHDEGRWRISPQPSTTRGRGLALIAQAATETAVHARATGTTVSMLWQIPQVPTG